MKGREKNWRDLPLHNFLDHLLETASEMNYIVSSGALNSTHSLTHGDS